MIKVNVILDKIIWKKKIKRPDYYLKKKFNKFLKKLKINSNSQEISIFLTNSEKMRQLNLKFRKKNKPTDVLSFPVNIIKKKIGYLGDVAISYEIVNKRSKKSNFDYEFDKMWVHGYLHLLGYDHKKNREFEKMHKLEKKILNYIESTNKK
tara:strand:+ start:240 stop:692 length:453 start_codon:yes stop_codon:yes gene_type:complete